MNGYASQIWKNSATASLTYQIHKIKTDGLFIEQKTNNDCD